MRRRAAFAAVLPLAAALSLAAAAPAAAAPVSRVIEGEHLRLVSTADPAAMTGMLPGEIAVWDVSVSADAPEPGVIDISLSGEGDLRLLVDVRACDAPWQGDSCPTVAREVRSGWTPPLDGSAGPLLRVSADVATHVRLEVAMAAETLQAEDATSVLRLHADGHGDRLEATPPGEGGTLPRTGMQLGGAALLALGAVVVGISGSALLAAHRRTVRPS